MVQPFVAYRGKEVVGRVVGVVNKKANNTWKTRNVRFSMIEFIDDLAVSKALLDTVEAWGKAQGMDKMQGPMGVTDFDKEGMLVEDFDLRGSATAYYNLDYYPKHMEQLGLVKEVDWLQIRQHPRGDTCEICPHGPVCPGTDGTEGGQGHAQRGAEG